MHAAITEPLSSHVRSPIFSHENSRKAYFPSVLHISEAAQRHRVDTSDLDNIVSLWKAIGDGERRCLLNIFHEKLSTSGPIQLQISGSDVDNTAGIFLLEEALDSPPGDWSERVAIFASTYWLLDSSCSLLTELNGESLSLPLLNQFFASKLNTLSAHLQLSPTKADTSIENNLFILTRDLLAIRQVLDQAYARCFEINGKSWHRTESYLRFDCVKNAELDLTVAHAVRNHLVQHQIVCPADIAAVRQLVKQMLRQGVNPYEIVIALAEAAVLDPVLQADYAVITMPLGTGLDRPWTMELQDICCYVAIRQDFAPAAHGLRLTTQQIRTAIAQRMRHNTVARTRNYAPDKEQRLKAQPLQFHDISHSEGSYYTGHIHAGIRTAARTHFVIDVPLSNGTVAQWRGLGDIRVNRVSDAPERQYTMTELQHLLRYGQWCKEVFQETIESGFLLDKRYCQKQA